jgi:hypothetical protein
VKIRFEDGPHPGLEEYVRTANLIVSWGDRKAVLRDEERSQRIVEHSKRSRSDHAIVEAVSSILESSGEPSAGATTDGLSMPEAELERIMRRAGLDGEPTTLHHLAFRNRRGDVEMRSTVRRSSRERSRRPSPRRCSCISTIASRR